jgi:hypothetical protein
LFGSLLALHPMINVFAVLLLIISTTGLAHHLSPVTNRMPTSKFDMSTAPGELHNFNGHSVRVFNDIIKSDQDKCAYRFLTLENGLQALIISEPGLDKVTLLLSC